jgi:hypothetical protein
MVVTSKYLKWIKPLKRSQKVRLRKELEERAKEEKKSELPMIDSTTWGLTWEQIKEMKFK